MTFHSKLRNKYNVSPPRKRTVDGIVFDSAAEARRYGELHLLEKAGEIEKLELQVPFELIAKFTHKNSGAVRGVKYIADFQYMEKGTTVVEDVKGCITQVYRIKRVLLLWKYPEIEFREVRT